MGGCAAMNCSNHSSKKYRMFKFPANSARRRIWAVNCRRDSWVPGPRAELCIEHFEESQFEQHRADNWKKLKPNAIPTLFNVPYPPPPVSGLIKIKGMEQRKPGLVLHSQITDKPKEHFERSQFEQNSTPPVIGLIRNQGIEQSKPGSVLHIQITDKSKDPDCESLMKRIAELEAENKKLKEEMKAKDAGIQFLSEICNIY